MRRNSIIGGLIIAAGLAGLVGAGGIAGGFGVAERAPSAKVASDFKIDGVHSSVIFKINHLGTSNFYGRINMAEGEFTFDPASPDSASINVTLKTDNIDSGNAQRDGHLKSPDFFDAKQFPTITFKSTGVKKVGDGYQLTGDLTLHGQTKPITAKFVHIGEKDAGAKFGYRSGFEATFTIKRSDFGMKFMAENGMLGDEVAVTASLEGVRK